MSLDTRLRSVFDTVLELDARLPDSALRYQETPGWDSLGAVLLISAIEDEFHVEIKTEQALKMDTFEAAAHLLRDLGYCHA
jgi:acyl carrier protein